MTEGIVRTSAMLRSASVTVIVTAGVPVAVRTAATPSKPAIAVSLENQSRGLSRNLTKAVGFGIPVRIGGKRIQKVILSAEHLCHLHATQALMNCLNHLAPIELDLFAVSGKPPSNRLHEEQRGAAK